MRYPITCRFAALSFGSRARLDNYSEMFLAFAPVPPGSVDLPPSERAPQRRGTDWRQTAFTTDNADPPIGKRESTLLLLPPWSVPGEATEDLLPPVLACSATRGPERDCEHTDRRSPTDPLSEPALSSRCRRPTATKQPGAMQQQKPSAIAAAVVAFGARHGNLRKINGPLNRGITCNVNTSNSDGMRRHVKLQHERIRGTELSGGTES